MFSPDESGMFLWPCLLELKAVRRSSGLNANTCRYSAYCLCAVNKQQLNSVFRAQIGKESASESGVIATCGLQGQLNFPLWQLNAANQIGPVVCNGSKTLGGDFILFYFILFFINIYIYICQPLRRYGAGARLE